MRRLMIFVCAAFLLMSVAMSAFAHTGNLVENEFEWTADLNAQVYTEVEPALQTDPHKGWWLASFTNRTGVAWAGLTISTGSNDKAALVKGLGLEDELGYVANSIYVSKAGTANYITAIGTRNYDNGAFGELFRKFTYTFATPIAGNGGKVSVKVYTDNSYYAGPYADYFNLEIAPTAVPEPGSMVTLMSGLVALAGLVRRRK